MIGVEISGVDKLLADFKGYEKEAGEAIKKTVNEIAQKVKKDAMLTLKNGLQNKTKHTRNSRLLSSIMRKKEYEKSEFEAVVGTSVEYAPYIEFGTGDLFDDSISDEAKAVAIKYKGKGIKKVNIKAVSFLGSAGLKNAKNFVNLLEKNLNKIKR